MFDRNRTGTRTWDLNTARGGVSFPAVLSGVLVAFGAMFLLSAVVGGVLVATGWEPAEVGATAAEATLGAGIVLIAAQFLSYLWGGYTAGRMGRGAGALNGLLVPITALLLAVAVGAIATALGANANLNLPLTTNRLPLDSDTLVDFGAAIGAGALGAMLLGGLLGGLAGTRWHTKLERHATQEIDSSEADRGSVTGTAVAPQGRTVDLREDSRTPVGAGPAASSDRTDPRTRTPDGDGTRTIR